MPRATSSARLSYNNFATMTFAKSSNFQLKWLCELVPMEVCEYHSNIINNALRVRGKADLGYIDGKYYFGAKVKNLRRRNFKLRQKLQAKGTKSAKRLQELIIKN